MNNDKISNRQMITMLGIFRITMALSYMASIDYPPNNQDNWIIILLSFFYIMIFSAPFLFLINKFKDFNMIEYISMILGKKIGKIINLGYGVYFSAYCVYLVVIETQLVSINLLSSTPHWIIVGVMLIVSVYILSKGIILIYWSGEMISTIAFVGIALLLVLGLSNVDIKVLLPILKDSTIGGINKGSFLTSLIFTDIFLLSMGAKHLEDKTSVNKTFIKGIIYPLLFVSIINIAIQTSLGVEQSRNFIYPFLVYSKLINYSGIFERIDIIYSITWISAHTGKIAIYLLFSLMCFKSLFNIEKSKIMVAILAMIVGIISIIIVRRQVLGIDIFILKRSLYISFIFSTIIPVLICIVYFFRRKSLKKYIIEEKQL